MTEQAINYGKVLYELGVTEEEIGRLCQVVLQAPQLLQVLCCPIVSRRKKYTLIDEIFQKQEFSSQIRGFLKVLCRADEAGEVLDACDAYKAYNYLQKNILYATLFYVTEPSVQQLEAIKASLIRTYQAKEIIIELQKKESLIGGFVIRIGSLEIDYSLEGRIKQMKQKLMQG